MINFGKLHIYVLIFVLIIAYFISGILQFFFGIPYVALAFVLILALGFMVLLSLPTWNFRYGDAVVIFGAIYFLLILISAAINQSKIIHLLIYLFFPLLPTFFYVFTKSGIKQKAFFKRKISLWFIYIALIQLPVVLFQRFSYDFLKGFNKSGQNLIQVDFWFGTFPLKADHALGFFMLLNVLNIYWNNDKLKLTKYPWLIIIWITVTVFLTDTKITQLLLAILFIVHAYMVVPNRVRIIGIITAFVSVVLVILFLQQIPILKHEYEYSKKSYTLKHSKSTYNSGIYARRLNIVLYYMHYRPLTLIGNGPYDYFNFIEGKFKKTHHFSLLIWTYNDLGLLGLITVILFMFFLVKSLSLSNWRTWLIFIILMIYSFMTISLFDYAFVVALVLIVNNNLLYEFDSDSIP